MWSAHSSREAARCPECGFVVTQRPLAVTLPICPRCLVWRQQTVEMEPVAVARPRGDGATTAADGESLTA
jgi:hypothetical protein